MCLALSKNRPRIFKIESTFARKLSRFVCEVYWGTRFAKADSNDIRISFMKLKRPLMWWSQDDARFLLRVGISFVSKFPLFHLCTHSPIIFPF